MMFLFISAGTVKVPEYYLLQALLTDYNVNVRPVQDPHESLLVSVGVAMNQIVDLVSLKL